jgi:hypothetical protein
MSFNRTRCQQLGIQTLDFWVREAADFIEYLFSFGSEKGVRFTEAES